MEEALAIARLGEHRTFPSAMATEPEYYPFVVARCLKHLGRSTESRAKYLSSLRVALLSEIPTWRGTSTTSSRCSIWRGELAAAERLVELDICAPLLDRDPGQHRWQVEHAFASIAYLRLLQGSLDEAAVLFEHAAHAWDEHVGERLWIYEYYSLYRSELILLADPDAHDDALAGIEALLAVARLHGWPESICRGHIQAAIVHLDRSNRHRNAAELVLAAQRLDEARRIAGGMNVADVAIAHHLTQLKLELANREYGHALLAIAELERLVERVELLIDTSSLALATPEVIAARGVLALLAGSAGTARELHRRAVHESERQGNALAAGSPRSLVRWLAERLKIPTSLATRSPEFDLVGLIGAELSATWMRARLDEVDLAS